MRRFQILVIIAQPEMPLAPCTIANRAHTRANFERFSAVAWKCGTWVFQVGFEPEGPTPSKSTPMCAAFFPNIWRKSATQRIFANHLRQKIPSI